MRQSGEWSEDVALKWIGGLLVYAFLASCHTAYMGIVRLQPDDEVRAERLTDCETQRAVDLFQEFAAERNYQLLEEGSLAPPAVAAKRRERGLPPVTRWMTMAHRDSMTLLVTESDVSICLFLYTFSGGRPEPVENLGKELRSAFAAEFGEQRVTLRWQTPCVW